MRSRRVTLARRASAEEALAGRVQCLLPRPGGGELLRVTPRVGYDGETRDGLQHGVGTQVFADGGVYCGQWCEGKMEGRGRYISSSGDMYHGEFEGNARHGMGRWTPAPGSGGRVWEGTWYRGNRAENPLDPPIRSEGTAAEEGDDLVVVEFHRFLASAQLETDREGGYTDGPEPLVRRTPPAGRRTHSYFRRSSSHGYCEAPPWLRSAEAVGGARHGSAVAAAMAGGALHRVERAGDIEQLCYNGRERSLMCLRAHSPLRRLLYRVVCSAAFQRGILLCIIANTVFIAVDAHGTSSRERGELLPSEGGRSGARARFDIAEHAFHIIFTIEAGLKIGALGFVMHDHAYLRHPANVLDFVIVVVGWVSHVPGYGSAFPNGANAVVVSRMIRPIRVMALVDGMRVVIVALARAWRGVVEVAQLLFCVLLLFAIIGVSLYAGLFNQACYFYEWAPNHTLPVRRLVQNDTQLPPVPCSASSAYGRQCESNGFTPPQAGDRSLPYHGYQACEVHGSGAWPKDFDNALRAALVVFQVVAGDDWPFVVHQTQSAAGWWSGATYYVLLSVFGTFVTINLFLAVIIEKYSATAQEAEEQRRRGDGPAQALVAAAFGEGACTGCSRTPREVFLSGLLALFPGVRVCRSHLAESAPLGAALNGVVLGVTLYNMVVLATEHHGQPSWMDDWQYVSSVSCGAVFVFEAAAKLIGLGARGYLFTESTVALAEPAEEGRVGRDEALAASADATCRLELNGYNCFDLFLALASLPELISGRGGLLQVLRVFRVFRLVRVYRRVAGSRVAVLISAINRSLSSGLYIVLTLILFLFAFAVMGIRLFHDDFPDPGSRWNFNDIPQGMLTVFVCISGDSWTYSMVDAQSGGNETWSPFVFYITMFVLGNYCLLNLCAAVVVDSFAASVVEQECLPGEPPAPDSGSGDDGNRVERQQPTTITVLPSDASARGPEAPPAAILSMVVYTGSFVPSGLVARVRQGGMISRTKEDMRRLLRNREGCLVALRRALESRPFIIFRVGAIFVFDVAFLALERPTLEQDPGPGVITQDFLDRVHYVSTVYTTLEVAARLLALKGRSALLWMDVVLLLVGYYGAFFYRPLRSARSLRYIHIYLTSLSRRTLLESLGSALQSLAQVVAVCAFIWLIFAVLGMQLFMGRLYYCSDGEGTPERDCRGLYNATAPTAWGSRTVMRWRRWTKEKFGFDNLAEATWTLLQVATGDSWSAIMYAAVDSGGLDAEGWRQGPRIDRSRHYALFFAAFMLVGSLFAINLFVGVLTAAFAGAKHARLAQGLTDEEAMWVRLQQQDLDALRHPHPTLPTGPGPAAFVRVRQLCFALTKTRAFRYAIVVAIVLNVAILGAHHYGQPDEQTQLERVAGQLFVALFAAEAAVKIAADGLRLYLASRWNRFDLFLAVVGLVEIGVPELPLVYVLRALRLFRLTRTSREMVRIYQTLANSLQGTLDVFLLLMGMYFTFGVIGVQAFGKVALSDNQLLWGTNFRNLRNALLTLYEVSTLVRWRNIKDGCSITPGDSDCTYEKGNCGPPGAWAFFLVFIVTGGFVGINLFVTVIFESFDATLNSEEARRFELLGSAVALWERADAECRGWLTPPQFQRYVKALFDHEFAGGWRDAAALECPDASFTEILYNVPIPLYGKSQRFAAKRLRGPHAAGARPQLRVRFHDVMAALVRMLCPSVGVTHAVQLQCLVPGLRVFTGNEGYFFFVHWYAMQRLISFLRCGSALHPQGRAPSRMLTVVRATGHARSPGSGAVAHEGVPDSSTCDPDSRGGSEVPA
eukprot:TRINITY_DN15640_c0_g1_i4.p1 TRINITY_DN15640_c0_g1~~TRINITY_DN15640_c0_g1_i4.p1  ORF type:complete len:1787 (+),score=323.88 TRINITY_DN15640_c0_g1_i4:102-5462(+)